MLVAAAVCPHPPLLVPEAMGAAGSQRNGGMEEVRAACDAAVAGLAAAEPDAVVVVGGARTTAAYEGSAAGSLREYGVAYDIGRGEPVLPLSLTIGAWLLRRAGIGTTAGLRAVARATPPAECFRIGAQIARQAPRVAMLTMGDGPARRAMGIPGAADPTAEAYDAEVAAALAVADAGGLARLAPSLDDELMVAGRAAWQVLAGAADGLQLRGRLRCATAQYEVGYLVASWELVR